LAPAIQLTCLWFCSYVAEWLRVKYAIIHHLLIPGLEDSEAAIEAREEIRAQQEKRQLVDSFHSVN